MTPPNDPASAPHEPPLANAGLDGEAATFAHTPVLLEHVVRLLDPKPGERLLDLTLGRGGHAQALLGRLAPDPPAANGHPVLIGVDRDPLALSAARAHLDAALPAHRDLIRLVQSPFSAAGAHRDVARSLPVDLILADLGVSSPQLDHPERGFSFRHDAPLDMRMTPGAGRTAADILATAPARHLERVFREFGEERFARRIASEIERRAKLNRSPRTTHELVDLIRSATPAAHTRQQRIHPATRVFQALRIAVNDELDELDRMLVAAPNWLTQGGRLAIISFHSLEDRRVKNAFRELCYVLREPGAPPQRFEVLTRRVVTADDAESAANPRARSAKLRVLRRLVPPSPIHTRPTRSSR